MAIVEMNIRKMIEDISTQAGSPGHSARPTSTNQTINPTTKKACQKRLISTYSQP
ncbi:MAG: hypothetical protein R3C40_02545 [Parvularculaceae bacterium]